MREVILSADYKAKVYSVPDEVADNLDKYCFEFTDWMWKNPNGAHLLQVHQGQKVAVFDETDFVVYLNKWVFPNQQSSLVKELDVYFDEVSEKYGRYPWFNF